MTPTREEVIRVARECGVRDDGYRFEFSEYRYLERLARHFYEAGLKAAPAQRVEARPQTDEQIKQELTKEFDRRGDSEGQGLHPYWKGAFTEGAYWAFGIKEKS